MIEDLTMVMRGEREILNINESKELIDMYLLPFEKNSMYSRYVTTQIYMLFFSLIYNSNTIEVSKSYDSKIFCEAVSFMKNRI